MAPEMISLDNAERDKQRYSPAVDIYAFGIVLNAMWRRARPYEKGVALYEYVKSGGRPEIPADCPAWLGDLMERCWAQRPSDRPLAGEVQRVLTEGGGP
jgi:serine/threonine protein kinase